MTGAQLVLKVRPGLQLVFRFAAQRAGPLLAPADLVRWRHWHARLHPRGVTGGVGPWQPRRLTSPTYSRGPRLTIW